MPTHCKICDKPLSLYKHNRQVYCSESCKKIGKDTHNRIQAQNIVFENLMKGRKCDRCLKTVHEIGMKKYCKKCRKDMKMNVKPCIDCGAEHTRASSRCEVCAKKRQREQQKEHQKIAREKNRTRANAVCKLEGCNNSMEGRPPQARYCSDACSDESKRIIDENRKKARKDVQEEIKEVKGKAKKSTEINPRFLVRNYSGKDKSMRTGTSSMEAGSV